MAFCINCGKALEKNEKFCSGCGTPNNSGSSTSTEKKEPEKPKYTKEGRKIITGGPKPGQNRQTYSPPSPTTNRKKKKKSCRGCAITIIVLLAVLVVGTMLLYNQISDWWQDFKTEQGLNELNTEGVDGIVDIEEGDVSHLPENRDKSIDQTLPASFVEEKALKTTTASVEKAFASADTTQLTQLLTSQSQKKYEGKFKAIQPEMEAYAKAFASKKLIVKTEIYALYSFENGNSITAEFAQVEPGVWKLVRF